MTEAAKKVGRKKGSEARRLTLIDRLKLASEALVSTKTVDKWYANAKAVNEGNRVRLERAAAKLGIERSA